MTTTADAAAHTPAHTVRRGAPGREDLSMAPGAFTAPNPEAGEPLLRLEASIAPAPSADDLPPSGPRPVRPRPRPRPEFDGRRPTELAGQREERRQIMAISRIVCQATLEALAGVRPVAQLQRWLEPETWAKVAERTQLMTEARRSGGLSADGALPAPRTLQVLSMRSERLRAGTWEVAVVLSDESRVRACALRLEAHRRRWRVVALELG